jgi:hypothetical protein
MAARGNPARPEALAATPGTFRDFSGDDTEPNESLF